MKKTIVLSTFLLSVAIPAYAQPIPETVEIIHENEESSDEPIEKNPSLTKEEARSKYPFIKFQDDVNDPNNADAYPWLSADGLRLYYVHDFEIFRSERSAVGQSFAAAAALKLDRSSHVVSVWLSNDERSLFTSDGSVIKEYQKKDDNSPFVYRRDLILDAEITGFVAGVSFTPDMKIMMLYNSIENNRLVICDVNADGFCKIRAQLKTAEGSMGIGQISKSGKHIYYSIEDSSSTSLYKAELMLVGTPDYNPELLYSFNDIRLGKPSLNYDETLISLNFTESNTWTENEIVIFDLKEFQPKSKDPLKDNPVTASVISAEPNVFLVAKAEVIDAGPSILEKRGAYDFVLAIENAWPVPSRDRLNIQYHLPVNCAMAELILTDLCGKEVLRKRIDPLSRTAELSFKELQLAQGNYFIWVNSNLGISATHKVSYVAE